MSSSVKSMNAVIRSAGGASISTLMDGVGADGASNNGSAGGTALIRIVGGSARLDN